MNFYNTEKKEAKVSFRNVHDIYLLYQLTFGEFIVRHVSLTVPPSTKEHRWLPNCRGAGEQPPMAGNSMPFKRGGAGEVTLRFTLREQ